MGVLDKHSGVWLVGAGETLRHLMVKCVLPVAGQEAKAGTEQLIGGVGSGIERGINVMRLL